MLNKLAFIVFFITLTFCLAQNPLSGNQLLNPSFESEDLSEYWIRHKPAAETAKETAAENMRVVRDWRRAYKGECSLLLENKLERGCNELNLNRLAYSGQLKYRFQAHYYLGGKAEHTRVAGRVTFYNAERKAIRHIFPEYPIETGRWLQMKEEFYPPPETARITVTLWFIGEMQAWLDELFFGVIEEKAVSDKASGARILAEEADFVFWKEAPYLKVPYEGMPGQLETGAAVHISAAANERESFQLVFSPKKDFADLQLRFGELHDGKGGVIPPEALSYRLVDYIRLKNPDNPRMRGWHADPLLPARPVAAKSGLNCPFYVSVDVPTGQKAGVYAGSMEILSGEERLASAKLLLQLRDFELPSSPEFKSRFYTRPYEAYNANDPRPRAEVVADMQRTLGEHRMNGNQALTAPAPKWEIVNGKLTISDWSEFDQTISQWSQMYGLRNFPVPLLTMMGDNGGWFSKNRRLCEMRRFGVSACTDEALAYMGQYAKLFTTHVREKFPEFDFYSYVYDEPPQKVYEELAKITDHLHKQAPELKIFIPKTVNDQIGYVQTWCVPFSPGHVKPEEQQKEVMQGKEIWYYNWPVRIADHDYVRNRLFSWQIYMNDGVGGLLWNTVQTPKGINPWDDLDKTHACGAATIFYPPAKNSGGIVPSLRSAQIRECIDDFDYFKILERRLDAIAPGQGRIRVKEIIREIIPDDKFEFVNDPHLLYALRERLASEIELAGGGVRHLLISTPPENSSTEVSEVKFLVVAEPGTMVRIENGAEQKVPAQGRLELVWQLQKKGLNQISFSFSQGEKHSETYRRFTLLEDQNIAKLKDLEEKMNNAGLQTGRIRALLANLDSKAAYASEDRQSVSDRLEEGGRLLLKQELSNCDSNNLSALAQGFLERAKWAAEQDLFARGSYYLALSKQAQAAGEMQDWPLQIKALDYKGHFALQLQNSRLEVVILETGGRIVSLKNAGVQCIDGGSFQYGLSEYERALQKTDASMITRLRGYNGYEDAGAGNLWPASFVDWNFRLLKISKEQMVISASVSLNDGKYSLTRTMTMNEDSGELQVDYDIKNLTPKEFASDDPEDFQLAWRGRLVPSIGGVENDRLYIPTDMKLPETHFQSSNPIFYEARQIALTGNKVAIFDDELQKGLEIILDPELTHAYIWFNSSPEAKMGSPLYTLEFPRSFYGKKHDDAKPNSPFTIPAETSKNFRMIFRVIDKKPETY